MNRLRYLFRLGYFSFLGFLLRINCGFLFNCFGLFSDDLFWLFNNLVNRLRFIVSRPLEPCLGCFFLGCFHSFEIIINFRLILSAFNRLILLVLSLKIIVVPIVVFVNYGSFGELELVAVESTRSNDILGKHMHEWLLVMHLLLHQFRYGIKICMFSVIIKSGECFQEVVP